MASRRGRRGRWDHFRMVRRGRKAGTTLSIRKDVTLRVKVNSNNHLILRINDS